MKLEPQLSPQLASPKSIGIFHKHLEEQEPPEEEEVISYSSEEELSDAEEELQQLLGEPKTPPKSQALAMPPPLCKEEGNQETYEDAESTTAVRNLDIPVAGHKSC